MLHYLFTNDLRHEKWPGILADSAELIHTNQVPSANEDKSKNNYIRTQESYLCIHAGTKANAACRNGQVDAVILNFINRFQFPNARTKESYTQAQNDGMAIAPLRLSIQLLFVLNLIGKNQAVISYDELAKYLICDSEVATGKIKNILAIAMRIIQDRKNHVVPMHDPDTAQLAACGVEWKQCPRQIKELFSLLEFAPYVRCTASGLSLHMPMELDGIAAKQFFYIVNNRERWIPPSEGDWDAVRKSYREYMDAGISVFESATCSKSGMLDTALEIFKKSRGGSSWSDGYHETNKGVRDYFENLSAEIGELDAAKVEEMFLGVKDAKGNVSFRPMWSGTNGTGWVHVKKGLDENPQAAIDAIRKYQGDATVVAAFTRKGFSRPLGFGDSVVSELLMKFHPDAAIKCGKKTIEVLEKLNLMSFRHGGTYDGWEYRQVLGIATGIKLRMDEMGITRTLEDHEEADYITVNEFIAWCHDNFQEIKNMAKQTQRKALSQQRTAGNNDWSKLPNDNPDSLMYRLAASLLTRPFAILAGASGTGKSRMVKKLACMTCYDDDLKPSADKPLGNYQIIQVKPSWHDSSELLGYRSMLNPDPNAVDYKTTDFLRFVLKAHAYPKTPFFVCLDEMNLAPVEQYFAEFLSACESVEKKEIKAGNGPATDSFYVTDPLIPPTEYNDDIENIGLEYPLDPEVKGRLNKFGLFIPRNLFVVGTVNMDDTTCQFSRKVLDRAMTIEMNEVKFDTLKNPEELIVTDITDATGAVLKPGLLMKEDQIKAFIERKDFDKKTLDPDFLGLLEGIQAIVKPTPFAVGYRFALETSMYREALKVINAEKMQTDGKDQTIPKAEGGGNETIDVSGLYALDHMILTKVLPRVTGNKDERKELLDGLKAYFAQKLAGHMQSADALERMLKRAESNGGYLSFWP